MDSVTAGGEAICRTSRRLRPARAIAIACVSMAAAAAAARADTIELADGNRIENVRVTRSDWDSVGYELAGVPQAIEGFKVIGLERPSILARAVGMIQSGDFAGAEDQLKRSLDAGQNWEKAYAHYLLGKLYLQWAAQDKAKADQAILALDAYRTKFKAAKDFYLPHATYDLGKAYLAAGKPKNAVEAFKELQSYGGNKGVWGFRALIGEASAQLESGGRAAGTEVRATLRRVIDDRAVPKDAKDEATILLAASYNVSEDYPRAKQTVESAFLKANGGMPYSVYYARACNVMGDAFRLEGGNANLQEAEIWYLKTTCFFRKYPDAYRSAAARLVEVYDKLGQQDRSKFWKEKLGS